MIFVHKFFVIAEFVFMTLMQEGKLSEKMQQRMQAGSRQPGWVKRSEFDWYGTIADREDS